MSSDIGKTPPVPIAPIAPIAAIVCKKAPPQIVVTVAEVEVAPRRPRKTPEQRLILREARHVAMVERRTERRLAPEDMPGYIRSLFIGS